MEQAQPDFIQPVEDGFSQFFIEPPPKDPGVECVLSNDAQEVLANLLNAYRRLRAASYRIGQLEGRLQKYRRLSRTLITQAAASNSTLTGVRHSAQSSPYAPAIVPVKSRELAAEFYYDDEPSWWQAITEGLFGSDHPKAGRQPRGRRYSGYNYYALIRDSVNRKS